MREQIETPAVEEFTTTGDLALDAVIRRHLLAEKAFQEISFAIMDAEDVCQDGPRIHGLEVLLEEKRELLNAASRKLDEACDRIDGHLARAIRSRKWWAVARKFKRTDEGSLVASKPAPEVVVEGPKTDEVDDYEDETAKTDEGGLEGEADESESESEAEDDEDDEDAEDDEAEDADLVGVNLLAEAQAEQRNSISELVKARKREADARAALEEAIEHRQTCEGSVLRAKDEVQAALEALESDAVVRPKSKPRQPAKKTKSPRLPRRKAKARPKKVKPSRTIGPVKESTVRVVVKPGEDPKPPSASESKPGPKDRAKFKGALSKAAAQDVIASLGLPKASEKFGAWVKGKRTAAGLSQRELGVLVGGASQTKVCFWELGERAPDQGEAEGLVAAFGPFPV